MRIITRSIKVETSRDLEEEMKWPKPHGGYFPFEKWFDEWISQSNFHRGLCMLFFLEEDIVQEA